MLNWSTPKIQHRKWGPRWIYNTLTFKKVLESCIGTSIEVLINVYWLPLLLMTSLRFFMTSKDFVWLPVSSQTKSTLLSSIFIHFQLINVFFYPFKNTNEAYTATLMSDLTSYMNTDIWGTLDTEIVRFVDNLQIWKKYLMIITFYIHRLVWTLQWTVPQQVLMTHLIWLVL